MKVTPRLRRRLLAVTLNAFNNLLVPIFTIAISALVVRLASPAVWGSFIALMVTAQLGAHLAGWGNKEYLLREFSRHPDQMRHAWGRSLGARGLLAGGLGLLALLVDPINGTALALWGWSMTLAAAFDVLVVFRKDFVLAAGIELGGTVIIVLGILVMGSALEVRGLLALFVLTTLGKAALYALHYRHTLYGLALQPDMTYFQRALPFFLLGFSGLLASRIDLYTISALRPPAEVAAYQVAINLLLYYQAGANFILVPFVKNIYRLGDAAIFKMAWRLFALGAALLLPVLLIIQWLLAALYDLHFAPEFLLIGGLFALPIFGYLPLIHRLHGRDEQLLVLWVNLAGAGLNLVLNLLLLPRWGLSGTLAASAAVQWGMLAVYAYRSRELFYAVSPLSRPA